MSAGNDFYSLIFTNPYIHRLKEPSLLCLRGAVGRYRDAPAAATWTGCAAFTMTQMHNPCRQDLVLAGQDQTVHEE